MIIQMGARKEMSTMIVLQHSRMKVVLGLEIIKPM